MSNEEVNAKLDMVTFYLNEILMLNTTHPDLATIEAFRNVLVGIRHNIDQEWFKEAMGQLGAIMERKLPYEIKTLDKQYDFSDFQDVSVTI